MTDAIAELMTRYALGHFEPRVRARLKDIFTNNPPDAIERLERAAAYLGVDGTELQTWGDLEHCSRTPGIH